LAGSGSAASVADGPAADCLTGVRVAVAGTVVPTSNPATTAAAMQALKSAEEQLTWQKLSPAEFQQLQDLTAGKARQVPQ
jgi:hypothetical protein